MPETALTVGTVLLNDPAFFGCTVPTGGAGNNGFTTGSGFSGSFVADKACQGTAQAFGSAVQKLVNDIVRNPRFKQITN